MLRVLSSKADARGLSVEVVCADVEDGVAGGPFDAVMERHVLGTLPRPKRALDAWRRAAPTGWLVCFESDEPRFRGRDAAPPVPDELARGLPYPDGMTSGEVLELVGGSEWGEARKERLKRVARAERVAGSWGDRVLGGPRRYAVQAGLA
jgi:hypothetical protein